MLLAAAFLASIAHAGTDGMTEPRSTLYQMEDVGGDTTSTTEAPKAERAYSLQVGFRGRMVSVPKSILDIWFFDAKDAGWPLSEGRPKINGWSLGLEFVYKKDQSAGIFYFDYVHSNMKAGYWDDREDPADHADGDWLDPQNLGLVAFGADYSYDIPLVKTSQTKGIFGMSFAVGGGLGLGVMIGQLDRWAPGTDGTPAYIRKDNGPADGTKKIPRVLPIVDVNAGLAFNFGDRATLRIEGGLHTLLYYGLSLGVIF